jgi:hypothetical protein
MEHHEITGNVGWLDSCAVADSDALRAIWPGERAMGGMLGQHPSLTESHAYIGVPRGQESAAPRRWFTAKEPN